MSTSATQKPRRLSVLRRASLGAAGATLCALGIGVLGTGAAFAQGTHHASAATAKARTTLHERRESSTVRASENSSNDPNSGDPNEPADSSSNDSSPSDEGSSDTSASDVNDSQDSSSVDSASLQVR